MVVYPVPGEETVIAETVPTPEIVTSADALCVVPNPTGFAIVMEGVNVYPIPLPVIEIELIVPNPDTTAVAEAPTIAS